MSEALLALREAKETLNRLLAQYPTGFTARRFELNKDLKHIQDQITILEKFLDPFTVEELENQMAEQWILWKRSTKKLKLCWNKSAYEKLRRKPTLKSG